MTNTPRVLIVDDHPVMLKTVSDILEVNGMTAVMFERGQQAIEWLMENEADLALVDLKLEDISGIEVVSGLKKVQPDIECILITGYASQNSAIKAVNAGAYAYLIKPYDIPQLMLTLQRAFERRQAAQALRNSEAKYRKLFEMESDALFLIDNESGRILDVNGAAETIYAYTRDELLNLRNVDLSAEPEKTRKATTSGATRIPLRYHRKKSDEVFPVEITATHLEFEGKPVHLAAIRDITERLRAEEDLRLLSSAVNSAANAIVITDQNGTITWVNPAFTHLTGYSREEAVGNTPRLLRSGAHNTAFYQHLWDTILSGKVWQSEIINRRKDGSIYIEDETITPLLDDSGQITHFIAIKQDITARKEAEKALLEKTAELDRYFTASLDLLCIADKDGNFRRLNPEWEKTLGYPLAELENRNFREFIHPDDLENAQEAVSQLGADNAVINFENRYRCKDGSYRWIEWRSYPQDNLIYSAARDITERKLAEAQLKEQLEELQRWHNATLGRESRVLALKKEVNDLLARLGEPRRYASVEEDDPA